MKHYQYVIVGGGLSGDAAAKAIREMDPQGSIGLFSAEPDPPYNRPSLSKGLWKGKPMERVWRKTDATGAVLHLDTTITALNTKTKSIEDNHGQIYSYEKLLLATGGTPRRLPFGDAPVNYYRNLRNYQELRAKAESGAKIGIIGGGYIGSELAAALTMVGNHPTMVFPEKGLGARLFPQDLSMYLNDYFRAKGVTILDGELVVGLEKVKDKVRILTDCGTNLDVDYVVAGLGITPNVELALMAGLKLERGIAVDNQLRTSQADVFAAGDVASFYNNSLHSWMNVEHEENALWMGQIAGKNMAGGNEVYQHLPLYFSDLFELGFEGVGEADSRMETVADWQEPFQKGVIYYLRDKRVRGVLLWNVWKAADMARALIDEQGPFESKDLIGRIPFDL
jgi:NADPH-dependent 2,4-dienoyl-CoA reductase/sulfur reductase-like enzyme